MVIIFMFINCTNTTESIIYYLQTESLFKKLCENKIITSNLIELSLDNYSLLFEPYFKTLLELASHCVVKSDDYLIDKGIAIYYSLFKSFDSFSYKQKVISSILSHINASSPTICSKCLLLLLSFTESNLINSFQNYTIYIKSILDIIYTLNKESYILISKIMCKLAYLSSESILF